MYGVYHTVGDLLNANNWRLILQIPLIGKLLENAINRQLHNYLDHLETLSNNQFCFRKNKSTSHAVFKLVTDLCEAIANKDISQMVYI